MERIHGLLFLYAISYDLHLPSYIFLLTSSIIHLPSYIIHLPSSIFHHPSPIFFSHPPRIRRIRKMTPRKDSSMAIAVHTPGNP